MEEFQKKKKKSRPFFILIFKFKNGNFKTRDFSPLIERVLAGVTNWLHNQLNASPMLSKKSEKVAKKVGKLNGRNS